MLTKGRLINLIIGPLLLVFSILMFDDALTLSGSQAVGVMMWMVYWWITRPVDISITAILPVITNAFLNMVSMGDIISQYSCPSIILIFGAGLMTLPWSDVGLDKRIVLKVLSLVGTSIKSHIIVWFLASVSLSMILPDVAVCALLCPIAVSMLAAAGHEHIPSSTAAIPILLAVAWGSSLGGLGTVLGGAMNLTAISFLEKYTGHEFMYIDWITHTGPVFIFVVIVMLVSMLLTPNKVESLEGTREYFKRSYEELGPLRKEEVICFSLFMSALLLAFLRPFYAEFLPGLAPAYVFLSLGFVCFFLHFGRKDAILTWEKAQKGTLWGMMILFAGGLALGQMLNGSGATEAISVLISNTNVDGGLGTIIGLALITRIITEMTNGTTAAAIVCPIVFGVCDQIGLNPIPYWFITVIVFNAEFILPISMRAIPVGYGLDPKHMIRRGIPTAIIHFVAVVIGGYVAMKFFPGFSELPYM